MHKRSAFPLLPFTPSKDPQQSKKQLRKHAESGFITGQFDLNNGLSPGENSLEMRERAELIADSEFAWLYRHQRPRCCRESQN